MEAMSGKTPGVDIADAAMCRAVFRKAESLLCSVGILVNSAGYSYSLGNVEDLGSVTSKRPSVFQWVSAA